MIDKTSLITTVMQRLKKLPPGHCLDIRTFKRNRSVAIIRQSDATFTIIEDGFHQERWDGLATDKVKRMLKSLLKKEFPRSHKVRIYTLESYDDANVNRMGYGAGKFGLGGTQDRYSEE